MAIFVENVKAMQENGIQAAMTESWRGKILAGVFIGLGAGGYLALGGIAGAVIFAFGLAGVVISGVPLYTGRAGTDTRLKDLAGILLLNIVGAAAVGALVLAAGKAESLERAADIVSGRIAAGPWRALARAAGCGVIIDLTVWLYRKSQSLIVILLGVPLFILCGFYHSIADVTYMVAAARWENGFLWYYPVIVIGNYLGCNLRKIIFLTRRPPAGD